MILAFSFQICGVTLTLSNLFNSFSSWDKTTIDTIDLLELSQKVHESSFIAYFHLFAKASIVLTENLHHQIHFKQQVATLLGECVGARRICN